MRRKESLVTHVFSVVGSLTNDKGKQRKVFVGEGINKGIKITPETKKLRALFFFAAG